MAIVSKLTVLYVDRNLSIFYIKTEKLSVNRYKIINKANKTK